MSVVGVVWCKVRGCDELITRPEEFYRLWCVIVCDLENLGMKRPWPRGGGCRAENKQIVITGLSKAQSTVLYGVSRWHFGISKELLSSFFVMHLSSKEFCKVQHKGYSASFRFSTSKILQVKKFEKMCSYMLWLTTSSCTSDFARKCLEFLACLFHSFIYSLTHSEVCLTSGP